MSAHDAPTARDTELTRWAADWGADTVEEPAVGPSAEERRRIRRRAQRHGWGLWAVTGAEILVSLVALAWVARRVIVEPSTANVALAVAVTTILLAAHALTQWNRRGTWRPRNQSIRAFAELEVLRQRRQLRSATRLLPSFLLFELALLVPWRIWDRVAAGEWTDFGRLRVVVAASVAGAFVLLVCWIWAWVARRRLAAAEALLRSLTGSESGPDI